MVLAMLNLEAGVICDIPIEPEAEGTACIGGQAEDIIALFALSARTVADTQKIVWVGTERLSSTLRNHTSL